MFIPLFLLRFYLWKYAVCELWIGIFSCFPFLLLHFRRRCSSSLALISFGHSFYTFLLHNLLIAEIQTIGNVNAINLLWNWIHKRKHINQKSQAEWRNYRVRRKTRPVEFDKIYMYCQLNVLHSKNMVDDTIKTVASHVIWISIVRRVECLDSKR